MSKRHPTAGRPPLVEGERPRKRMALLPPDLDDAAQKVKGRTPWSEWLRGLVEDRVEKERER